MKSVFMYYIFIVAYTSVVRSWSPSRNSNKTLSVCSSKECKKRGELYATHMDTKVHPCEDFYEFACGSWGDVHPTLSYQLESHIQDVMNEEALKEMKKLLEAPVKSNDPKLFRKAKIAYQFCVDKPHMPRVSMQIIKKNIQKIRRKAKQSPWFIHDEYLRLTGESPFFTYSVLVNEDDNYRPTIQFEEPVSAYGSMIHSMRWTSEETMRYKEFLMNIYKHLAVGNEQLFTDRIISSSIEDLIMFRTKLDQLIVNHAMHKEDEIVPMSVKQLEAWYNSLLQHTAHTSIDWRKIASILYSDNLLSVSGTTKILSIRKKSYFIELAYLLRNTPLDTIERHIEMFFIERHLIHTDKMIKQLTDTLAHMDAFLGDLFHDIPRWVTCIENHHMQHAIEIMYVNSNFHGKNVEPVKELILDLKDVLLDYVKKSPHTSIIMKSNVAKQISSLTFVIGYPRLYVNTHEKERGKKDAAFLANAKYNLRHNRIYISAAFMRSPMFEEVMPEVVNVGSIGTSIAHELNHIFGDCGYYPANKMQIPWWTNEGRSQCEKKKQCFVDEYRKYTLRVLGKVLGEDKINRMHTFTEDFADVMGLKIAYRYFFETLKGAEGKCEVLPHFEQFTCEQMFFISFANTMCGKANLQLLTKNYDKLRHNMRWIRVNGAVMHNDKFAAAFGCPAGSPMNPERKCDLWK